MIGLIGAGSIGLSFLVALSIVMPFLSGDSEEVRHVVYTWLSVGNFESTFGLYLDGLTVVMILVIT